MAELYYFSKLKADLKPNSFADNEKVKLQTSTSMRHDKKIPFLFTSWFVPGEICPYITKYCYFRHRIKAEIA